jgi:tRNA 2-thiouridine synthesizing protein C
MKKVVILSTQPPYGSALNAEAFRVALGLAFSEISIDLILVGDGIYAALKQQQPLVLQMKPLSDVYAAIEQFKINLFLDSTSIAERRLSGDELVTAPLLETAELAAKINAADAVLTF